MSNKKNIVRFAALLAIVPLAYAANWQEVDHNQTERIEIDTSRIARIGNGKTMAWSRLVLGRNLPIDESSETYSTVEALNRYDCEAQRFTTVKRIYLRAGKIIKQETVGTPREMSISADSVDAKLFSEACPQRVIAKAMPEVSPVTATESPAKAMYADVIRSADDNKPAPLRTVSDTVTPATKASASPHPSSTTPTPGKVNIPTRAELAARAAAEAPTSAPTAPAPQAAPMAPRAATVPGAHGAPQPAPSPQPAAVAPLPQPLMAPAPAPVAQLRPAPSYMYEPVPPRRVVRKKRVPAPVIVAPVAPPAENHALDHVHWSYEGEGGPTNWSKLRPDYASCATGKRQSPIDIRDGVRVDLEPIQFDYKPTQFRVIDNGHTVQVNVGSGSTITLQGHQYELVQFHFHRPAEERINGKTYDMVIHLVHKDYDGQLAVVAILLEKGSENPLIQTLWNNLPLEVNLEVTPTTAIDLNTLLPETRNYWTYMGSLTTPPCSEGVLWIVLKQPQQISPEQISIFSRLYRNNARPIQGSNSRLIKESR